MLPNIKQLCEARPFFGGKVCGAGVTVVYYPAAPDCPTSCAYGQKALAQNPGKRPYLACIENTYPCLPTTTKL